MNGFYWSAVKNQALSMIIHFWLVFFLYLGFYHNSYRKESTNKFNILQQTAFLDEALSHYQSFTNISFISFILLHRGGEKFSIQPRQELVRAIKQTYSSQSSTHLAYHFSSFLNLLKKNPIKIYTKVDYLLFLAWNFSVTLHVATPIYNI